MMSECKEEREIDFSYSITPPHRLCISLPESEHKTLLDASLEGVSISWTDGTTKNNPLGAFMPIPAFWNIQLKVYENGTPLRGMRWRRIENWIPALEYSMEGEAVRASIKIVPSEKGDIIRFEALNTGERTAGVRLEAFVNGNVVNMKWADFEYPYSISTPIFGDRGDRMLLIDSAKSNTVPKGREYVDSYTEILPGNGITTYFIRPYKAYLDEIDEYVNTDWNAELEKGLEQWRHKTGHFSVLEMPDKVISDCCHAALADMFVMREEQADGHIAGLAGTDVYRAANTSEPCLQAGVFCTYGYFDAAAENISFVAQFQESDGNWEDYRQWGRFIWSMSGWKSQAIWEYYIFTGDREFLKTYYPRMKASAEWSRAQRKKTKEKHGADSPYYGLMPRGMGDCGLNVDGDLFGVFYPHNFLHCMGIEIAARTARELGYDEDAAILQADFKDMKRCILRSLERGCIKEEDYMWIPGSPGCRTGSRWGVADAVYPTHILEPQDPLAVGTMHKLQSNLSEGGLPVDLGWIPGGLWVAIALDAMAYVNILQGNADKSAEYLKAALNHATPLVTWCEERTPEAGSSTTSGDKEHAWTPICVARFCRDMMIMEDSEKELTLHVARAVPRSWFSDGKSFSLNKAPTAYGLFSCRVETSGGKIMCKADMSGLNRKCNVYLHIRMPKDASDSSEESAETVCKIEDGIQYFNV